MCYFFMSPKGMISVFSVIYVIMHIDGVSWVCHGRFKCYLSCVTWAYSMHHLMRENSSLC